MTKLLSQSINWYTFVSIYLSSGTTHGLVPIFGPFFPIITPQNSSLLLLGEKKKKKDFDFWQLSFPLLSHLFLCRCLFNYKRARSWRFGIQDTSAFTSDGALSPTFYDVMEILWWRNFIGILVGALPLTFPIPIYIACRFWLFYFLHLKLSRTSPRSLSIFS